MGAPVIGVTSYVEQSSTGIWHDTEAVWLPDAYIAPVRRAGAVIAVLPEQDPALAADALARVDALYLTGGYDVDPAAYGADAHLRSDAPRAGRDAWEIALVREAHALGMPILGVCRGAQVLNVARGGTLHQHVPDVVGHDDYQKGDAIFRELGVSVLPDTLLASLHPLERDVPMYHHQAIDRLGDGLVVSARSVHGLVEAVEDPDQAFCLALQWHPEHDEPSAVWDAFVAAARVRVAR
ncbi:gamma-glutamyl-gamma-aminobutyrate hydrolase family protein [Demequina sp. SYSU T00192]|uniref:Gamma-glutamyl-gamma-aminobutyrate hydrolase family protein n=1 Tax=Demequina litoralis TaxID=3051660 RepID=A0ABT8G5J9_9MICO|nr:gamma-glutamyl-gamma-aminobutyrate hydrolase family protein [Demequina sp. SYSU T00192]MDN4474411.1 gamma-glutamyl-gamma-aminobutyrate hydrolase family protein [Demequina sp. SYSU T00192]